MHYSRQVIYVRYRPDLDPFAKFAGLVTYICSNLFWESNLTTLTLYVGYIIDISIPWKRWRRANAKGKIYGAENIS
jgi:hypothetical protein